MWAHTAAALRLLSRAILVGVVAMLALASFAAPHVGPPIWIDLLIEEDRVTFTLSGEPNALATCLGERSDSPTEGAYGVTEEALRRFLREQPPLRIDGRAFALELTEVVLPTEGSEPDGWQVVEARCRLPVTQPPGVVDVVWKAYDGAEFMDEVFVPLTIVWGRKVQGLLVLKPSEPEHIWRRPDGPTPRGNLLVPPVVSVGAERVRLPLLSLGTAALSIAVWVLLRGRRSIAALRAAIVCGGLVGAALLRDVGTLELGTPGLRAVALPGRAQALAIFETLHGNVYDAFSARTEGEIYDLLSASVDATTLDELYGDVYESLIMREQGGAICSIERIEVLEKSVTPSEAGDPGFAVDWSWRVHGVVSHWGHLHRRINQYRATYRVEHDGQAWKIGAVDVLEHQRIDVPDPSPTEARDRVQEREG